MVKTADADNGSSRVFSSLGLYIMAGLIAIIGSFVGLIYWDLKGDLAALAEYNTENTVTLHELDKKIERGFIIDSLVIEELKEVKASINELEDQKP